MSDKMTTLDKVYLAAVGAGVLFVLTQIGSAA